MVPVNEVGSKMKTKYEIWKFLQSSELNAYLPVST